MGFLGKIDSVNDSPFSTVFHITHWKAGSQWVRSVLNHAAADRCITPTAGAADPFGGKIIPGGVYTPLYLSASRFRALVAPNPNHRIFVVIRDPRDSLISWYFSLMYSHGTDEPTVQESREELQKLPKDQGIALMITKHLNELIQIQREWIADGTRIFRYEDFRANQQETFRELLDYCGIELSVWRRRSIVRRHSFIRRTFWRFGRENVRSHLRKGVVGDWKNHLNDELKRLFKSHHGQTLVAAEYEKDDNW
jgi:lipopolysaccharide transport system ATP-binding protein